MSADLVLRCSGLAKRYGDVVAVDGFDLDVRRGEVLALLGPSGCGKTTALRLIAGLERPDAGEVHVGDRRVAGAGDWVPPERRRVGIVFQDWALFPHLDVWHNVAFGLDGERERRVEVVLDLVRLEGLAHRMPHELSGGQQQRVALARALAPRPEVILLDEPFSNLDARLRAEVRGEVRDVLRSTGTTAVFVTHDQEEALSIADRIAVMAHGRTLQAGTPHEVYARPATREVAALVGDANLLRVTVSAGEASSPLGRLRAPGVADGEAEALVRPEALEIAPDPDGRALVTHVEFYGHDQVIRARLPDGSEVAVRLFGAHPDLRAGAPARVAVRGPIEYFPLGPVAGDGR